MEDKTPDEPDVPDEYVFFLEYFWTLNSTRTIGLSGLNPMSYVELEAWQRMNDVLLSQRELNILMRLAHEYDAAMYDERPRKEE